MHKNNIKNPVTSTTGPIIVIGIAGTTTTKTTILWPLYLC